MISRVAIPHLSFLNQNSRAHVRKKELSTRASACLNVPFACASEVNLKLSGALWRKRTKYLQTHTQVVLFAANLHQKMLLSDKFRKKSLLDLRQLWNGTKTSLARELLRYCFQEIHTYDKTIWASSAISLLTQKVPVRRRDVIDIKVRLSHFVTWLVASFVVLRKGPKLVSTDLFIGIPVVAQS